MAAKFVQIAVGNCDDGESLYALDDEGVVWFFNWDSSKWVALKEEAQ